MNTSCPLKLERNTVVAGGAEELSVMGRPEDIDQGRFVARHPLDGRQSTDGPVDTLARNLFLLDENHHTGEETLQEMEEVRDGRNGVP